MIFVRKHWIYTTMINVNITSGVKKLKKMPIDVDVAKILFALISVDDTLPKKEEGYRERR